MWWARRPLGACRAVLLASLLPDPADASCPPRFVSEAAAILRALRERRGGPTRDWGEPLELRSALLAFIGEFSNWDNASNKDFLVAAQALVTAGHEALGGSAGTRPLVVDPFAGGGTIPVEALRVGADAYASDLNPVAVILNKVALEYVPRFGTALAEEVREAGNWVYGEVKRRLGRFYPDDPSGATPIAYLWARTIQCEGPGCGAVVPLLKSLWLSKKPQRASMLQLSPNRKHGTIDISVLDKVPLTKKGEGTVKRGAVQCPLCGYTTRIDSVRRQLRERRGGSADALLVCVVTVSGGREGRAYRLPTERDLKAVRAAGDELKRCAAGDPDFIPTELISTNEIRRISVPLYGMAAWGDLFTPRQALALGTFVQVVANAREHLVRKGRPAQLADAVVTCLALAVDRLVDRTCCLARWRPQADQEKVESVFGRQALGMTWDFAEGVPLSGATAGWEDAVGHPVRVVEDLAGWSRRGAHVERASATNHPLPDDSADALITDPPYYDAVPYAHLSDFFYVWLKRTLKSIHPDLFVSDVVQKDDEIVVDRPHHLSTSKKDIAYYERALRRAFRDGRRVVRPTGIGVIVFASKSTASWEAILEAVIGADWVITGSWPIDTEMEARIAARGQARLASSVHLVCRPRESSGGSAKGNQVGDWRAILQELPKRIHEWLPRLAEEGIVGADAIFACLGPALEIFSRFTSVEKVSGEQVALREYLEHVWAAVSNEALSMIFEGAETTGLESDARLTAMWLWTLAAPTLDPEGLSAAGGDSASDEEENEAGAEASKSGTAKAGYSLEFDAARKIAQGLGARLEELTHVVEVKGDTARLLGVAERTKHLFAGTPAEQSGKKNARKKQMPLFSEVEDAAEAQGWGDVGAPKPGVTVLDQVHQAMLLFGSGRSEALRSFLVEEGIGKTSQFWRLGQSLSALYPAGSDEKRWVDGVLARKKGLGFG